MPLLNIKKYPESTVRGADFTIYVNEQKRGVLPAAKTEFSTRLAKKKYTVKVEYDEHYISKKEIVLEQDTTLILTSYKKNIELNRPLMWLGQLGAIVVIILKIIFPPNLLLNLLFVIFLTFLIYVWGRLIYFVTLKRSGFFRLVENK